MRKVNRLNRRIERKKAEQQARKDYGIGNVLLGAAIGFAYDKFAEKHEVKTHATEMALGYGLTALALKKVAVKKFDKKINKLEQKKEKLKQQA